MALSSDSSAVKNSRHHRQDDTDDDDDARLIRLYRRRLDLDDDNVELPPTYKTLCLLTERHLAKIPFENLSLHMQEQQGTGPEESDNSFLPPIVLDRPSLVRKLLINGRGGCCLELNGLLAHLLRALGYHPVHLVPCYVAAGRERGHATGGKDKKAKFRTTASHIVLRVAFHYWVDVGLGEPPLHPLLYHSRNLGVAQRTPDGMVSRIRWDPRGPWRDGRTGRLRTCLIQEWQVAVVAVNDHGRTTTTTTTAGEMVTWEPRLQWDVADAPLPTNDDEPPPPAHIYTLSDFLSVVDLLVHPRSSLARKLVCSRLTATHKITLAGGRTLKVTTPRFGADSTATYRTLTNLDEVYNILRAEFGIHLLTTAQRLQLTASDHAHNTQLWNHL